MKKLLLLFAIVAILGSGLNSCVSMKRDCQGVKHTRLPNGIYL